MDSDAYNSVGGFVFAELGRLPRRGDTVTAGGFSIRVESVRENRVEAVRIRERRSPPPREVEPREGNGASRGVQPRRVGRRVWEARARLKDHHQPAGRRPIQKIRPPPQAPT